MSPVRPTVQLVGTRLDPEAHRVRDFLTRIAQPHELLEAGSPEAEALLAARGATGVQTPALIDGDNVHRRRHGRVAGRGVAAFRAAVARALRPGDRRRRSGRTAAAVYAASDGLSTLLVEADVPGGQASHTSLIENFFGFVDGIGGAELARLAGRQAERFGAELVLQRGVVGSSITAAGRSGSRSRAATSSPQTWCSRPPAWSGAGCRSRASTSCSDAASTTERGAARPPSAAATTWS